MFSPQSVRLADPARCLERRAHSWQLIKNPERSRQKTAPAPHRPRTGVHSHPVGQWPTPGRACLARAEKTDRRFCQPAAPWRGRQPGALPDQAGGGYSRHVSVQCRSCARQRAAARWRNPAWRQAPAHPRAVSVISIVESGPNAGIRLSEAAQKNQVNASQCG